MHKKTPLFSMFLALGLLAGIQAAQAQKMYKWVDEDGNVFYSDQIPPEHIDQAHQRVNEQGIVVDDVERAKTREEIEAERKQAEAAMELMRQMALQAEEDRKLLAAYSSTAEIINMRDRQLEAIDRQMVSARGFLSSQTKSLADLLERAASQEATSGRVNQRLQNNIDVTRQNIAEQNEFIEQQEQLKRDVRTEFADLVVRYREVAQRNGLDPEETAQSEG